MAVKFNLGCGQKPLEGYINCDFNPDIKADRHFDLNVFPYPLDSGSADEVFMDNVLEHLNDVTRVMCELHRILKPGGMARIKVPYAKSDWAYQDPTHKAFFTEKSMDYFAEGYAYNYYTRCRFKVVRAELIADSVSLRHKLRNCIPFRSVLRFFLFNLYDSIEFELVKV